jgi:anti-sigma B factor antagonist
MIYKVKDGNIVMNLSGELDIGNADNFKQNCMKIAEEHKMGFVIDCKDLNFIDSTALGAFVSINNKIAPYQKKLVLKNLKPNVKKLFLITKLDKSIQIVEE